MVKRKNISTLINSYLLTLAEQVRHYAVLRVFGGLEAGVSGKLCLDAQLPVLNGGGEYACALAAFVSYRQGDIDRQEFLSFEIGYEPQVILTTGPARWGQSAGVTAYQMVNQLVQWKQDKQAVNFNQLEATTGLKPDRQRYYV